jgi:membrane fusion protein (multidrug efflux system)
VLKLSRFKSPIVAALVGVALSSGPLAAQESKAPPTVQTAKIAAQDVTRTANFVGRIEAIQQVDIHPRVEGFISSVNFTEGGMVKTGQLLFTIDPSTYEAALENAKAAVEQAEAALASAQAQQTKTELQYERTAQLRKTGTVSQAQMDDATAARDAAVASVQQAQAAISAAKAQQLSAQINLDYTKISSPIDGQIGKAAQTVGNLVSANSAALATIVQTNPIRVAFAVSDVDYLKVIEAMNTGQAALDNFIPRIKLADGSIYPHPGKISFANNVVDASTGTITVRADFENPERLLVPGQFVNVIVQVGQPESLPFVPGSAVLQDVNGAYVFVVGEGNKAEERRIKTAQRTPAGWAVTDGLKVGDEIIVGGLQRVSNGIVVNPVASPAGK